jgi:hypothetical protein
MAGSAMQQTVMSTRGYLELGNLMVNQESKTSQVRIVCMRKPADSPHLLGGLLLLRLLV